MKQAATRELYSYWDILRGDRLAPERGEIDPTAIRGILADTFVLEVDEARRYPFRLSGTRFNALFMHDLKGRSFRRMWAERDRDDMADVLTYVCDDAAAVIAGVVAAPLHRTPIELELLLLPVRHLGKTHSRIIGCLAPAKLPPWIGLLPVESLGLTALRILPRAPRAAAGEAVDAPGLVHAHPGASKPRVPTRHGHLFVHQGEV